MSKKILIVLLVFTLIPAVMFAGITGKITGKVVDKDTGEPLPGVNVLLEGTMMGAASDINGVYIMLNIPVGTYIVKAQYIGYKNVSISNIRVHADLTTEVNFDLPTTVLEGETVSIVAERPIINKNVTNTVKTLDAEDLKNIPMRGVETVMNLSSAVVTENDGGDAHVRGGRSEENVTYIDGVMTTRLRDGTTNALTVINNAIEEANFQAGGFNAEYGFANAGVLLTTTKSGGADYHYSFEALSDEVFKNSENQTFGTQSWGYNTYTLTAGGPIPFIADKKLKFFVAGERTFNGGTAGNWEGLVIDTFLVSQGDTLPVNLNYGAGPIPGYSNSTWDVNGNLSYNPSAAFRVKFGGTFHKGEDRGGTEWNSLLNLDKLPLNKRWNASAYLKFTHQVNPRLFYTLNLNYFYWKTEYGDPDLWGDIRNYANPEYNLGRTSWTTAYDFTLFGFYNPSNPGAIISRYGKDAQENYGPKFDLTWQFNNYNELKAGFQYDYYTERRYFHYSTSAISLALHQRDTDPENNKTDFDCFRNNLINYGYDIWGNEISDDEYYDVTTDQGDLVKASGHDAARHPIRGAFYFQDKIELKDLVLNAGFRIDYFSTGVESWLDPARLIINNTNLIDDQSYGDPNVYTILSPRLGWSFPVTDKTVFHAQFGKFVQMPQTSDMYDGSTAAARFLQGGNARSMPNPNLEPMQTIQYEVGIKQQIGMNASLNVTAFYKDIKDYIQLRVFAPEAGYGYASYYQYQNVDYGTTKGFQVNLNMRRTNRISASFDYTYSTAMGTGSNSTSHFDIAWQDQSNRFPTIIMPLDYNQDHVGNINFDFRLTKDDGPTLFNIKPLANFGVNMFYSVHSGSRYTKVASGPRGLFAQNGRRPVEPLNSSVMPWYHRMDIKIDRTVYAGKFSIKPYVWIYNVFNRKNVTDVYLQTGAADNNGWFLSDDGKAWLEINGAMGEYMAEQYLKYGGADNINNYSTPRIMRFGILVEF